MSSSPFLLNTTIDHHLKQFASTHPELIKLLSCSIYVDDIVCGAAAEDTALPTCYTDSQVALYWIVGHGKEWKQFIQNRVLEI